MERDPGAARFSLLRLVQVFWLIASMFFYVLLSGVSARRTLPAILDFTSSLELSLNLRNSHAKPALDFGDVSIVAEMSALIEVLEVGAKFLEKITWGPGTHRRLNLARMRVEVCPVRDNG